MNEVTLHGHLRVGLKEQGAWSYKIPDNAIGAEKPFDIVASMSGKFMAIEAKIIKVEQFTDRKIVLSPTSFKRREHQLRTLQELRHQGALAFIVVGVYQSIGPFKKRCFAIDALSYVMGEIYSFKELYDHTLPGCNELVLKGGGDLGVRWSWPAALDTYYSSL